MPAGKIYVWYEYVIPTCLYERWRGQIIIPLRVLLNGNQICIEKQQKGLLKTTNGIIDEYGICRSAKQNRTSVDSMAYRHAGWWPFDWINPYTEGNIMSIYSYLIYSRMFRDQRLIEVQQLYSPDNILNNWNAISFSMSYHSCEIDDGIAPSISHSN